MLSCSTGAMNFVREAGTAVVIMAEEGSEAGAPTEVVDSTMVEDAVVVTEDTISVGTILEPTMAPLKKTEASTLVTAVVEKETVMIMSSILASQLETERTYRIKAQKQVRFLTQTLTDLQERHQHSEQNYLNLLAKYRREME
ncbi:hypothetical protein BGX29_011396 [Mortierella sp. GBA35]|nr:hypothetical protein BGX29_011396 [Mortierella sp. GBA35]